MTEWTTARVEDRLESAADVFRTLPGVMPQGFANAWPEYFHSFADKVGQEPQMRRPRPSPRQITEAEARDALQQLDPLWDELFPAEQARIVQLLVERIDIGTEGLNVRLRIDGLAGLAREMTADRGAAA